MIVPVRCYTCGKLIGDKYYHYKEEVADLKKRENRPSGDTVIDVSGDNVEKTVEGRVMDKLGIIRLCCRKVYLGHIEFK